MFRKWRHYEWARFKRATVETNWLKWFGGGFLMGLVADGARYEFGLRTEHDTIYYIGIAIGCAAVGALIAFFSRLLVLPATIATEQQETFNSTIATKVSEITALRQEQAQLKQQLEKLPEKPFVSIEGVIMPYGVQDFSGFRHGIPVGLDIPPVKMVEKFFIKVRNQSSFAVNIDAVGFMVKDTPLQGYFVDDSNTPVSFPIRLEARASLTARFFKVSNQGHSLNQIDGLYVETGCGHTFKSKDSQFAKWSLTADIKEL